MTTRRPPRDGDSALATRLFVVEEDVRELKTAISSGFASLHTKFEERSKIQWPAWTLFLATIIAVGGFAYWPIRENQQDLKTELLRITTQQLARERFYIETMMKLQVDVARNEERVRGRD